MTTDYAQLANLIARYSFLVDAGEFAELGSLFRHADLSLNGGEPVHGAEAIEALARTALITYADGSLKTRHVTSNLYLDIDEQAGTALSRSYFTVFQSLPEFPLQPIAAGHYRDRFARIDGAWQFAERVVSTDFSGDASHHVRTH